MLSKLALVSIVVGLAVTLSFMSARAAELIMVDRPGCPFCARFDQQIGATTYARTEEAKRAPLRRVDISRVADQHFVVKRAVVFTPTFLLVEEGQEIARMEGYVGDEFFWPALDDMLAKLPPGEP